MRLIAAIMTLIALAAAAFAGQKLRDVMMQPDAQVGVSVTAVDASGAMQPLVDQPPARRWAPLFGDLAPPTPPEPPKPPEPEPEPQPPTPPEPPKPPVDSLGYTLKGVIRAGDSVWAMVSHPTGEQVLRVGDAISDGVIIKRIDETGLWVDNGGDDLELLGFAAQNP